MLLLVFVFHGLAYASFAFFNSHFYQPFFICSCPIGLYKNGWFKTNKQKKTSIFAVKIFPSGFNITLMKKIFQHTIWPSCVANISHLKRLWFRFHPEAEKKKNHAGSPDTFSPLSNPYKRYTPHVHEIRPCNKKKKATTRSLNLFVLTQSSSSLFPQNVVRVLKGEGDGVRRAQPYTDLQKFRKATPIFQYISSFL